MNEKCDKWQEQIKTLLDKLARYRDTYQDALDFAAKNPKSRDTAFKECRNLKDEIKPLVMELREQFPRLAKEQKAELKLLKTNFDSLPELHEGIKWEDVDKSLKKSPDAINKLMALDEKGHKMTVFGENNGEIQFRSAQTDITKIAEEHRTIMYDKKAQTDYPAHNVNGNAVDIAKSMGVELADEELYERLRVKKGWVWLKTDADTRKTGFAFYGTDFSHGRDNVYDRDNRGSFCAALRVKKA